ncbi:Ribosomal RNA small subunit methyltransferase A [Alkalidesulfovibrio alkalitolerans DSM 16529]|uniref:Ribosomal RNA small subunit methyltransferase A n=1 Tax=Alkalidesulfovibrio alkalitolerans DSM 16529 TaxID=1121439 RepID=S7U9Z0_9BACT|nr:16S rRNA (adenine(1518)-N(6)/adenine(1519)-N(6))-dimethyltransferase RsmA [Alkalidesulfovibrio alkalitolerans]EPR30734.1 Ribosomal RNA small subunit methyltransferase A [Alkalidesulfovibrio alkalitolerans DSM 16529]
MASEKGGPLAVRAKRSLGQNFLVDRNIARRIVAALGAPNEGPVLEIGPGQGALTSILAETASRPILALEKDRELARLVKERYPQAGVVIGDGLSFAWEGLAGLPGIRLIGNLPYNVASPMLWEIVHRASGWNKAVFMVQYEVGRRIVAVPGNGEYGALSVWLQAFSTPRLLFKVPPQVFRPIPKIDSAVLSFVPRPPGERPRHPETLSRILATCFQKRRKQLKSILKMWMTESLPEEMSARGIPVTARPEDLSVSEFIWLGERIFGSSPLDLIPKI